MKGLKIIDKSDRSFLVKLKSFIDRELNKSSSFRYFQSRPIEIINNHVYTTLLVFEDTTIGYAHLDKDEDGKIWLGIAIDKDHHGKGLGKMMMNNLLKFSDENSLNLVLSVDLENVRAIKLYEKYGFQVVQNFTSYVLMMREYE